MILVDLNVVLDVIQKRRPHYPASAAIIETVVSGRVEGVLPAHAITTIHYIVARYQNAAIANRAIDWLLQHFGVVAIGRQELLRARALGWKDFEDAVVASAAEAGRCETIVTRNVKDYGESTVPALTPTEFLISREVE